MPSKYAFMTHQEAEAIASAHQAVQAQSATEQSAGRKQTREEAERQRHAAMMRTIRTMVNAYGATIVDIITDYTYTEYGTDISIREQFVPPELYAWTVEYADEMVLTVFLLVQGDPPEAGLFVDGQERLNFQRLLIALRTYTGLVAWKSDRAAELRERLRNT